jgi:hypothetical protein
MKKLIGVILALGLMYFMLPYHVQMGLKYVFADVDDYKIFDQHIVHKSTTPSPWADATDYNKKAPSAELLHFL